MVSRGQLPTNALLKVFQVQDVPREALNLEVEFPAGR
jgi:hypothetical protein